MIRQLYPLKDAVSVNQGPRGLIQKEKSKKFKDQSTKKGKISPRPERAFHLRLKEKYRLHRQPEDRGGEKSQRGRKKKENGPENTRKESKKREDHRKSASKKNCNPILGHS